MKILVAVFELSECEIINRICEYIYIYIWGCGVWCVNIIYNVFVHISIYIYFLKTVYDLSLKIPNAKELNKQVE